MSLRARGANCFVEHANACLGGSPICVAESGGKNVSCRIWPALRYSLLIPALF
jgi:hypothetical protein